METKIVEDLSEQQVKGLFAAAGITVLKVWKLANQYWPDVDDYQDLRRKSPWWLVKTPMGLIEIGRRKRVYSIDWSETSIRKIVTEDETTKDETMVHAYSPADVLTYLLALAGVC